jgi:hypothetical protein
VHCAFCWTECCELVIDNAWNEQHKALYLSGVISSSPPTILDSTAVFLLSCLHHYNNGGGGGDDDNEKKVYLNVAFITLNKLFKANKL